MGHGLEKKEWFFAHNKVPDSNLPHCPCKHQHNTPEEAKECARRLGLTHITWVKEGQPPVDQDLAQFEIAVPFEDVCELVVDLAMSGDRERGAIMLADWLNRQGVAVTMEGDPRADDV